MLDYDEDPLHNCTESDVFFSQFPLEILKTGSFTQRTGLPRGACVGDKLTDRNLKMSIWRDKV